MSQRTILFEKIPNARDLGGLTTSSGRRIRRGLLIRSAGLADASSQDVRTLQSVYRLQRVIDLRTDMEKQKKPDVSIPGAEYCPIPVFAERQAGISHEEEETDPLEIPIMETLYRMMVTEESCRKNLGRAARTVMTQDFSAGSVLWHCTEGKDRCGLLTMVVLMALDVSRECIREDYLLTNEVNGPKAQGFYEGLLAAGKPRQEAEAVRNLFLAKESYLQGAFDGIDASCPDTWAFLTEGLEIPEEAIFSFREQVLL